MQANNVEFIFCFLLTTLQAVEHLKLTRLSKFELEDKQTIFQNLLFFYCESKDILFHVHLSGCL